jgi:Family of unknown function (DUF5709)
VGGYRGDDETDAQEASGLLEPGDVLEDDGYGDVLDRGYSPRDSAVAADDWGMTAEEESADEPLAGRLARELPDGRSEDDGDGLGDVVGTDGELRDDEVGDERSGRLAEGDDGYGDEESELWAEDEGIDGAAASAEEAAVHVVRDDDR